jgi:septal ring factor EnvC (AmiA/AmiB activator)
VGSTAGFNLTTGDFNIDIGNNGVAGEAFTIRIGDVETQTRAFIAGIFAVPVTGTGVVVDSDGQLGVAASSQRFKDEIKPMNKASEAILALKPVTFRYKHEIDPKRIPQFGLVAEEVEKVNPDLVVRDKEGKPYTVRYDAVNAMLLNEFIKEHHKVRQQEATIADLRLAIAEQRKDFETTTAQQQKQLQILTASLKEQAAQLEKVSARVEVSKRAPQTVVNNQ